VILLDTNVISALMRRPADAVVVQWLDAQASTDIWSTSVSVFEVRLGLAILPAGGRRRALEEAFQVMTAELLGGRIAPFDVRAAEAGAELAASRRRRGLGSEIRDTQIGGIALARRAAVATRNVRHFQDLAVPVIDPWAAAGAS